MPTIKPDRCIKCYFEPDIHRSSVFPSDGVDVYFGDTEDFKLQYSFFQRFLSNEEKIRAERFRHSADKNTFITCHGLLRLALSGKLGISPSELVFCYDINNKPGLAGNPYFFNITNSRDAFAFVISKDFYAGIDIEKADRGIDFLSILNTFFSEQERRFILESKIDSIERFFLLWTRKEALLKAIGTGITASLTEITVSEEQNAVNIESFGNQIVESVFNEHYIYSLKIREYYLSIALPQKTEIKLNQINNINIYENHLF